MDFTFDRKKVLIALLLVAALKKINPFLANQLQTWMASTGNKRASKRRFRTERRSAAY